MTSPQVIQHTIVPVGRVTNCDRFGKLKNPSVMPLAFTEHGALMAATVLNSPRAVNFRGRCVMASAFLTSALRPLMPVCHRNGQVISWQRRSVFIVRAFVQLRGMLASHQDLARKMNALERNYDSQFKVVFDAIRQLMEPPASKKKPIGFKP